MTLRKKLGTGMACGNINVLGGKEIQVILDFHHTNRIRPIAFYYLSFLLPMIMNRYNRQFIVGMYKN